MDDDDSVQQAVRRIEAELGPVEVLVNNAGIEGTGSVEEMPVSVFRDVMETNCFGAIRCIQAVLPGMRARRSGCIANVTSISGKLASSPMGAYAASNFALEAVSECLAQEVKPFGIRVCVVEPGIIDTDMARHFSVAGDASVYPNQRRMAAMFVAALQQPTPPGLVADKLVEIADGGSWQFRHPVGPDAAPFLQWRASLRSATRPGSSGARSTTTLGTHACRPTSEWMRGRLSADCRSLPARSLAVRYPTHL